MIWITFVGLILLKGHVLHGMMNAMVYRAYNSSLIQANLELVHTGVGRFQCLTECQPDATCFGVNYNIENGDCLLVRSQPTSVTMNITWTYLKKGVCYPGWHQFQEKCLRFLKGSFLYDDADAACTASGGQLVSIDSQGEITFVVQKMQKLAVDNCYIGLTWDSYRGEWVWRNGQLLNVSFWNTGEPGNQDGSEDCVVFSNPSWAYRWWDVLCYNHIGNALCEMDLL